MKLLFFIYSPQRIQFSNQNDDLPSVQQNKINITYRRFQQTQEGSTALAIPTVPIHE